MKHSYQDLFMVGANHIASMGPNYGSDQQAAGFSEPEWDLLTDVTMWSRAQQKQVASAVRMAVSLTLRVAGLAPTPLPGVYVAAVICQLVAPCNRLVAAQAAPESYDAIAASGLFADTEVLPTTQQAMTSLIMMFSSGDYSSVQSARVDEIAENAAVDEQV